MSLKDTTFAVIAEKPNSAAHKWFIENCKDKSIGWHMKGGYYIYDAKSKYWNLYEYKPEKVSTIYTESEFEQLLKEEENRKLVKVLQSEELNINAEINQAIELLKSQGYKILKPSYTEI